MTRSPSAAALLIALVGLASLALAPGTAAASEGSVPTEVRAYVEDGDLVERLADVYGPDAAGNGIDFDDTTETGEIHRVHVWTEAQLAGDDTETPIQLLNEWVVPISIGGEPVGLATFWINPDRVEPELARFDGDPDLAAALAEIGETEALVRDDGSSAWFALSEDDVVTPLVPGTSGLTEPIPLDEIALLPVPTSAPAASEPNTGLALALGVMVVLVVVIVVALLYPGWRDRRSRA
jgi:hypothetical protein